MSFGLLGCDGAIGERAATPEDPTILPSVEVPTVEECAERAETVGATPLRRLTRRQLRNAFADLLGTEALDSAVEERLQELTDGREGGFESSAGAPSAEALRGYVAIGELMATQIVADPSSLVACDLTARSCARELLGVVGRRLFRRPLAVEEIDAYLALRDEFIETDGVEVATTTALSAVMASPHFVYLGEPVDAARRVGETVGIVPHAVASRLSFFLWNSIPDEALLAAAEAGELQSEAQIVAQVERMLEDSKATRHLRSFYGQWLTLEQVRDLSRADPTWTPALAEKLVEETHALVQSVMTQGSGTLHEILTTSETYGDPQVAAHYGAPPPDSTGRIQLDPEQRAGVLTSAAMLAQLGSVNPEIHRGGWVRAHLLCDPPPLPVDVVLDEEVERLATEPCVGCHLKMDPVGYGFDAFDDLGRYDEERAANARQASVISPDGALEEELVGDFASARELAERLASSATVETCVAQHWFRFALGRSNDEGDGCGLLQIQHSFSESGGNMKTLATDIARSLLFQTRSLSVLDPADDVASDSEGGTL